MPCLAQSNWGVVQTFHIGGEGSWDYVTIDAPNHRLFVTRSTHTQAIDTDTGKVLGDIPGQVRSHGVAIVPKLNRGFITDGGGTGAIIVFDLKTYAVLGKIATMPDSDGIIYDAKLDRVLAVSGDGNALMTISPDIDPKTGKVDPHRAWRRAGVSRLRRLGKVFVNLEDKESSRSSISSRARSSRAGRSRPQVSPSAWPSMQPATASSSAAATRSDSS